MNRKSLLLTVLLCSSSAGFALPAEEGYDLPVEHRLQRLTKELQLNADQQAKLEIIFKEQHEKFRAIHEQSHERIKAVLTPEQLAQWEAMKKQHQEKRRSALKERVNPD